MMTLLAENYKADASVRGSGHTVVLGASGAGKTTSIVVRNIQEAKGSVIVYDIKNQLHRILSKTMEERGYRVQVLDLANNNGSHYNPLMYIRAVRRAYQPAVYNSDDIKTLAHMLVPGSLSPKDRFWTDSAALVLEFCITMALDALPRKHHNMAGVSRIFTMLNVERGRQDLISMMEKHQESRSILLFSRISDWFRAESTWSCITAFAANALAPYEGAAIKSFSGLPQNCIDLHKLTQEKTLLIININECSKHLELLTGLLNQQIFKVLVDDADKRPDGRLPVGVDVYLDDAASIYMPELPRLMSNLRSRKISVCLCLQSLAQLYAGYGSDNGKVILSNAQNIVYMGSPDPESVHYISQRVQKRPATVMDLRDDQAYVIIGNRTGKLCRRLKSYFELDEVKSPQATASAEVSSSETEMPEAGEGLGSEETDQNDKSAA